MSKYGLETHTSIGNYLVPILAEAGSLCDAQHVFDRLVDRNEYSWTSLITGYIECGESRHALNLYQKMQEDCVHPNGHTFVALLKACARLKDEERGRKIHAEIARKGLERDLFVGTTLVDMYGKCGLPTKAREVFDKILVRNEASWNALISGYAKHGLGEEALNCFEQMQLESVTPNAITFVCSLKACGNVGAISKGQEIHAKIARQGLLERYAFVGNALVDMYARCGSLAKAQEVFDKLPARNVVSWTALIVGYAKHGFGDKALNCFGQMQLEGVSPDALTFVCSLLACGRMGTIDSVQEIHVEIAKMGLEKDPLIGSTLVDSYAKCGSIGKACEVFDKLPIQDAVSWTALITGYAEHGLGEEALKCFEQMQQEGISPNTVTFVSSLKACGIIGAADKGREIHAEISRRGLQIDLFMGSTLVAMYSKCGSPAKAQDVFDKLADRNEVTWNALITAYAEHGLGETALKCFEQMQLEGISPNSMTFVCSLKACGGIGALKKGQEIHVEIARNGLERDLFVGSALVDMYAKCGLPAKACQVFDKLPLRDVVSWNALIAGYAHLGESENVFHIVEMMRTEGVKPDGVTFLCVLTVCSHTGVVDKGYEFFKAMSEDYGIIPTIDHHSCMVDLLGRAGQLVEVVAMMKEMPFHADLVMWRTLLGACQKWGNVEIGRQAFEHAMRLDEKDAAAYVLMSNMC